MTFGLDGRPSFPLLGFRACGAEAVHGRSEIPVTLMVFDVLRIEGEDAMCLPFADRRALLEALDLNGPVWRTPELFDEQRFAIVEATWDSRRRRGRGSAERRAGVGGGGAASADPATTGRRRRS